MGCTDYRSVEARRECFGRQPRWQVVVELVDVRHTTTEDHDVGIEGIDDHGQPAGHPIDAPIPHQLRQSIE